MEQATQLLEKLVVRTIDYISNDLSLDGLEKEFQVEQVDSVTYLDITSSIKLNGLFTGKVVLSVTKNFALKMVENAIFGEVSKDDLEELASENVAETLNIVLGNILMQFNQVNDIEICAPEILQEGFIITQKEYKNIFICKLKYENEQIILGYFE